MHQANPLTPTLPHQLFLWAVVLIDLASVCVNGQEMYHCKPTVTNP